MWFLLLHDTYSQMCQTQQKKKIPFESFSLFKLQPAAQIDIWQKGSDGTHYFNVIKDST